MEEITLEEELERPSDPFEVEWSAVAMVEHDTPDDDAGPSDDDTDDEDED